MTASATFDVVIVGGGAAGCVVAGRLSVASRSVLLLEAGPDIRDTTPDELRNAWRLAAPPDWGFEAEPDDRDVVETLRRGKLLGGTSWLTRFALRGAPADYDEWGTLAPGWSFDEILPFFTRLETDADHPDDPWHGDAGPIPVRRYLDIGYTDVGTAALLAFEAAGFPPVDDHNRPGAVGAGRMPMSSRDGVRVTTADAYLPTQGSERNLTIRPHAQVARVLLEGDGRAAGVQLLDGEIIGAGTVVLSAGTFGTPAIMLRSGIGPADHLRSLGIPVHVDLPGVGENLTDHKAVDIDCGYCGSARPAPILHAVATFHSSGTPTDEAPDLMLWIADPTGDPPTFGIDVVLLRPRSRGIVRLRSADPTASPWIDLPAFDDPVDLARLAEGSLRALEVANRPELRRLCQETPTPDITREAEVQARVHQDGYTIPHLTGTCAMGERSEDGAVVDPAGRVFGVEGLSVIDASVIPNVLSAFTHFPTIMLAERLSDVVSLQIGVGT